MTDADVQKAWDAATWLVWTSLAGKDNILVKVVHGADYMGVNSGWWWTVTCGDDTWGSTTDRLEPATANDLLKS